MNEDVFTRQKRPPCSTQSDEIELDTQNIVEPKATDFLKSPKVKVIRFISIAIFAILSIACVVIGCLNLNNCPLDPKLPLLLILFGIWGLASCVYSGFFEHLPWKWLQLGSFYILYLMIFAWVGTSGSIIVLTGMTSQSLNFSANQTCSLNQSWNNVSSANESSISTGGGDKITPKAPNPPYCDPATHATVTVIVLVMDIGYLFFIAALGIYKWKDKQIIKTSSVIRNMWSSHKKLQSFGPAFLLLLNAVFAVQ
uniref:Uncharacterized protein n=1 Tax=Ciona savignyi TaxID=51511 RepID=H2YMD4_CIOSA